jgi:putative endonuclease
MLNKKLIGNTGEKIACGYLGGKGYIILDKNISTSFGELDIIAISPLKTLVFIEVKTMLLPSISGKQFPESYPHISGSFPDYIKPEDQLSFSKISRFKKMSEWYANKNPNLSKFGYRLDAICIDLSPDDLTATAIRHYEGI